MKREEKNFISLQRILDTATQEFARQGYGLSSVNTICNSGGISKGILYHYFKDKDALYLACLQTCFDRLTAALREGAADLQGSAGECLESYFDTRLAFFEKNPQLLPLFCEAVISPPTHLQNAVQEIKAEFDALNVFVLTALLEKVPLQPGVTVDEVGGVFRLYQDFINARYRMENLDSDGWKQHEQVCKRSLHILLYGVVERGKRYERDSHERPGIHFIGCNARKGNRKACRTRNAGPSGKGGL